MTTSLEGKVIVVDKPYHIVSKLGRGAYAYVYKAKDDAQRDYAIKIIPSTSAGASCLEEASFLSTYSHRHINSALAVLMTNDMLYIVQEYATHGDLYTWVKNHPQQRNITTATNISHQIGLALAYIHREGVIHADIKPENVLAYNDHTNDSGIPLVKLSDFNLSVNITWPKSELVCSNCFRPPEAWAKKNGQWSWNEKVDVWSYAATMYYVLFGFYLFRDQDDTETSRYYSALDYWAACHKARNIINIVHKSVFKTPRIDPRIFDHGLYGILFDCLNPIPEKRPTVVQILSDKTFASYSPALSHAHTRRLKGIPGESIMSIGKNRPDLYPLPPDVAIELTIPASVSSETYSHFPQAKVAYDIYLRYSNIVKNNPNDQHEKHKDTHIVAAASLIAQKLTKNNKYDLSHDIDHILAAERTVCRTLGFLLC